MRNRFVIIAALMLLCSLGVSADVRTDQKTQVQFGGMLGRVFNLFGGKGAREGVTSTVAVKGNRKITTTGNTSQIIDLSEEKIYDLDLKKKSYKVTTFAQLRKEMEEARRKAEEEARREAPAEERGGQEPQKAEKPQKEVEVDFDVKKTGATKTLAGLNTSQTIMTVTVREKGKTLEQAGGMVLTTDMWLAPTQKSLDEVAEFDRRYAEKLYGPVAGVSADQMAMAIAMYPMMKDAADRMSKEGDAFEGTAIMTTVTFEAVKGAEQVAAESKQQEQQAEAKPSIGGMLGGLAKRMKKPSADEQKTRTTVMTSSVETLKIATDVADADLAIPAGFKENK